MLAVKIIALVFVALACCVPLYLRLSRPSTRYRRSPRSKRRRRIASVLAFSAIVFVLAIIAVLAISEEFFTDLI